MQLQSGNKGYLKSHLRKFHLTEVVEEAGEMAQWWQAHTALSGDSHSIAGTHFGRFTTTCCSSSRRLDALFWSPWAHALMCTHTIIMVKKKRRHQFESRGRVDTKGVAAIVPGRK